MKSAASEMIAVGHLAVRFLVESSESNESLTVFECSVPADARMPAPHSHDAFEETIYGLEGVISWTIDGESREIGPGDAICVPRGVVHGFDNRGEMDAKMLCIASPGVFGPSYFREIGQVLAATGGGPPDRAAVMDVMRRHGLTPAPAAVS